MRLLSAYKWSSYSPLNGHFSKQMYLPCFCFFDLQQPYYTNLLMEKSLVKENSCQRYHFAKAPIQS